MIDVREPAEWDDGHIDSAMSLPMFEAVARRAEVPDRPHVRRACARAACARARSSDALKRQGLGAVLNVTGGMAAWVKAGYSVSRETAPPSTRVPPRAADAGVVVDCRGLSCPWPSMKLAKAIVDVRAGRAAGGARHRSGRATPTSTPSRGATDTRIVERSESQGVQRFVVQRAH